MNLQPIVNREVHTIQSCENEPIHVPGSIQPHGCLLAIDTDTGVVRYCSDNTQEFLGMPPDQLLQQKLAEVLPAAADILEKYKEAPAPILHLEQMPLGGQILNITLHRSGQWLIMEAEQYGGKGLSGKDLFTQTTRFAELIDKTGSLAELCYRIAVEVRELTGFDRVMIYRFDKAYNGEVIAESKRSDWEPLLGVHYPHTDIPAQARDLYTRSMLRMIPEVGYVPVPLLTVANGIEPPQLDLSVSILRSVSPIHVQYLHNMRVASSMSVSLLLEGKLWGLIACHHGTPRHIDSSRRQAVLMQGALLTSQIRVREVAEEYAVNVNVEAHLQSLLARIPVEEDFSQKVSQFLSLLSVAGASGAVIVRNGQLFEKGLVPPTDKIRQLLQWLSANVKGETYCTAHLTERYPGAAGIARYASGILFHALGKADQDCIIWFRQEWEQTLSWAGNPEESMGQKAGSQQQLLPRVSFAIFKESVRLRSKEWRISEINAAIRFAAVLQNDFHLQRIVHEEAAQRLLNEQLQKANQELANINWITSHDLKEPIRKIYLFADRVLNNEEQQLSDTIAKSVARIQESAARMQILVDDIMSYSLITNKSTAMTDTDLGEVASSVIDTLQDGQGTGDVFTLGALPTLPAIPFQMTQLFSHLLGNSQKFSRPGIPLRVKVEAYRISGALSGEPTLVAAQTYYRFTIRDNGIGFDPDQAGSIFDIFCRLHDKYAYPGTGIGLAICRKIIDLHGGVIRATGIPGEGATFTFYLPIERW